MRLIPLLMLFASGCTGSVSPVEFVQPVPFEADAAESDAVEWKIVKQRQRDPVEAPKPDLPEHPGEPEVARLPFPPPAPPGSFQAAAIEFYATHPPIEPVVPANSTGLDGRTPQVTTGTPQVTTGTPQVSGSTPQVCDCGPECDCDDCQCPDCPHRVVKESLTPRLVRPYTLVFTAPWCAPCKPAKAALAAVLAGPHGDVYGRSVTFVDADTSPRRVAYYGVTALPCYVLVDGDLRVVARHVGAMTADQYRQFVDEHTLPAGASPDKHDAQRHDAGESGGPSHVQVNAGRGTVNGVCVGTQDGRSIVLTNHHACFDPDTGPAGDPSVYLDGEWITGELLASDEDADLALFNVPRSLRPVAIADAQPAAGSQVRSFGFVGGRHTPRVTVTLAGFTGGSRTVGHYLTRHAFIPGESGSAVMAGDRLVGLVSGRDPSGRFGVVVDLASIRAFLTRQGVL